MAAPFDTQDAVLGFASTMIYCIILSGGGVWVILGNGKVTVIFISWDLGQEHFTYREMASE